LFLFNKNLHRHFANLATKPWYMLCHSRTYVLTPWNWIEVFNVFVVRGNVFSQHISIHFVSIWFWDSVIDLDMKNRRFGHLGRDLGTTTGIEQETHK
jgi:hypothetical protein